MSNSQTVSTIRPAERYRKSVVLRVLAVTGSAGFAGGLFYWHNGAQIAGQPVWLIAGLLYATSIGLTAALIFKFLPRLGAFMELTSVSRLLLAGTSAFVPAFSVALTTSPMLNATMVVLGAVFIRATASFHWLKRMRSDLRFMAKGYARFLDGP